MKFSLPSSVIWACRVISGAAFLLAGLSKLGDLPSFAAEIHNFRILPVALENLAAITMPWIEIVAGLALVLGIRARAGAMLTASMLIGFTVAIVAALIRGLDIECGCFGTADATTVGAAKVIQNVVLIVLALAASLPRKR